MILEHYRAFTVHSGNLPDACLYNRLLKTSQAAPAGDHTPYGWTFWWSVLGAHLTDVLQLVTLR